MSAVETARDALFGNPPQPNMEPSREGLLAAFSELQASLGSIGLGAMIDVAYEYRTELDADLAHDADTVGFVYADDIDANNDLYVKVGASGSGSWEITTILHDAIAALAIPLDAKIAALRTEGNTIYTPATREANAEIDSFRTYYDRFYGLEISIPSDINGADAARLFVTRIGVRSSAPGDADFVGLTISQLKKGGGFEAVAECYEWGPGPGYFDSVAYVVGKLVGVGDYAGRVSGKIRMERTVAWNYFFAGGNNATQIARAYSNTTPGAGSFEIDPAFVRILDPSLGQPAYSVFAAPAYQQKAQDQVFREHIDSIFDMHIDLANSLDAKPYKRLFITAISSYFDEINVPAVEFSYLDGSDNFVLIAKGKFSADTVSGSQYDAGNQFVEYMIVPETGYEGLVGGRFRWLRAKGWNYFFNGGSPITWSDTGGPALGSLEISQDNIYYMGEARILPNQPSYAGFLDRVPDFAGRYERADQDTTMVLLTDSIGVAGNYASDRADAAYRPPLFHEFTMFSYVEEKLRWKGQQYRRFDVPGVFTETATTKETKEYDAAWDWQTGTPIVPNIQANFRPAITRVLTDGPASVSYAFPAGMRRCDFIYRTDYLCAASMTVAIAGGNGKVQVWDENTSTWLEANGYSLTARETNTVLTYDILDPYGDYLAQPLRKSIYQKRLKMRSTTDLTAKAVTISNNGSGRLNYWGIEYSPRPVMFRLINSGRGGHNISRLRAFEAWDVDYWTPDLLWINSMIINEGAASNANMPATNTPAQFAGRFSNYVAALRAKSFTPEVIASTQFVGAGASIVDQTTGVYNVGSVNGYGPTDVFNYVGYLDRAYAAADVPHLNLFPVFLDIAERLAAAAGSDNIWTSAIAGSGTTGGTLTSDGTHPNDYGSLVGATAALPAFDRIY